MKKLAILLLGLILIATIAGCSKDMSVPANSYSPTTTPAAYPAPSQSTPPPPPASTPVVATLGPQPSEILPKLEKAYNDQDLYAVVECYEPSAADAMFGLLELFGVKGNAMKQIMPFFSKALGASGALDDGQWGKAKLSEISSDINGSNATLKYNVNLTYSDGTTKNLEDTIQMVLVDGTWYISAFQFQMPTQGADGGVTGVLPELFDGELYVIQSGGKYGYADENGIVVISGQYTNAQNFVNGYAAVSDGKSWGFINKANRLVIPYEYQNCGNFADGLFPVQKSGYWGCVDVNNKTVVDFIYRSNDLEKGMAEQFRYERMPVVVNNARGVIDTHGNYIIPLSNDIHSVAMITDSFIVVSRRGASRWVNDLYDINGIFLRDDLDHRWSNFGYMDGLIFVEIDTRIYSGGSYVTYPAILDSSGNELFDISNLLESRFGQSSKGIEWYLRTPQWALDKWVPIGSGIRVRNYDRAYNFINTDGEFLLEGWVLRTVSYSYSGLFSVCWTNPDTEENMAVIFDKDGNMIYTHTSPPGFNYYGIQFLGGCNVALIFNEEGYSFLNLDDGSSTQAFPKAEIKGAHTAIVSDGIFYGLVVNGKLTHNVEYTKISYNKTSDTYTLEKGADRTNIRVDKNGSIIKLS